MKDILINPFASLYYATIKRFLETGLNVIVDTLVSNDKFFNNFYDVLADYPIIFVGVHCSKEELTRREQSRENRATACEEKILDYIRIDIILMKRQMKSLSK